MKSRFALVAAIAVAGCASAPARGACDGVAKGEVCVPSIADTAPAASAPEPPAAAAARGMIAIPAGKFLMGSDTGMSDELPVHEVHVGAFSIDATEVTVADYRACFRAGACPRAPVTVKWAGMSEEQEKLHETFCNGDRADRSTHPINCVDHDEAEAYCKFAGKRLPTEPEWEYAARGPGRRRYPWGDAKPTARHMNGCGVECKDLGGPINESWTTDYDGDDGWATTAPVGSFPEGKSPFGVLDMSANVWEWTASRHCTYGKDDCDDMFIQRGGGWTGDFAHHADPTTTYRGWSSPGTRSDAAGFRCAK